MLITIRLENSWKRKRDWIGNNKLLQRQILLLEANFRRSMGIPEKSTYRQRWLGSFFRWTLFKTATQTFRLRFNLLVSDPQLFIQKFWTFCQVTKSFFRLIMWRGRKAHQLVAAPIIHFQMLSYCRPHFHTAQYWKECSVKWRPPHFVESGSAWGFCLLEGSFSLPVTTVLALGGRTWPLRASSRPAPHCKVPWDNLFMIWHCTNLAALIDLIVLHTQPCRRHLKTMTELPFCDQVFCQCRPLQSTLKSN